MVLSIPSPSEMKGKANRPHPHLEASPYEHHFDTYSLVQQLASEGFSQEQAVTLMKAIRLMLAVNLDVAKESLVSKSDTENETYLFRAACSELRTTLQTARQSEIQKQRSTRAQLQHEADILNQKVTQDIKSLQEELKGMFNDRKMSLEEDRRRVNSKISELNYEITVLLNSDSKSEVEGLRWVLTRRAALAIAAAACESLLTLAPVIHANRANSHGPLSTQLLIHQGTREGRHRKEAQSCSESARGTGRGTLHHPITSAGYSDFGQRRPSQLRRISWIVEIESIAYSSSARNSQWPATKSIPSNAALLCKILRDYVIFVTDPLPHNAFQLTGLDVPGTVFRRSSAFNLMRSLAAASRSTGSRAVAGPLVGAIFPSPD